MNYNESNRKKTLELCPQLAQFDKPGRRWQVFANDQGEELLFVVIDPKTKMCWATMQDSDQILPGFVTEEGEIVFPEPGDPNNAIGIVPKTVN
jgi:hypothetical protein